MSPYSPSSANSHASTTCSWNFLDRSTVRIHSTGTYFLYANTPVPPVYQTLIKKGWRHTSSEQLSVLINSTMYYWLVLTTVLYVRRNVWRNCQANRVMYIVILPDQKNHCTWSSSAVTVLEQVVLVSHIICISDVLVRCELQANDINGFYYSVVPWCSTSFHFRQLIKLIMSQMSCWNLKDVEHRRVMHHAWCATRRSLPHPPFAVTKSCTDIIGKTQS